MLQYVMSRISARTIFREGIFFFHFLFLEDYLPWLKVVSSFNLAFNDCPEFSECWVLWKCFCSGNSVSWGTSVFWEVSWGKDWNSLHLKHKKWLFSVGSFLLWMLPNGVLGPVHLHSGSIVSWQLFFRKYGISSPAPNLDITFISFSQVTWQLQYLLVR